MVHLMTSADEEGSIPLNGTEGQPIEWETEREPPPNIEWNDSTSVYSFPSSFRCPLKIPCLCRPLNTIGMPHYKATLLSSWTPKFLPSSLYYPPAAKIPNQILNSIRVNEFVSYAPMPKELQGKRNVAIVPKMNQGRFRSGKARVEQVRLVRLAFNAFLLLDLSFPPVRSGNAHI